MHVHVHVHVHVCTCAVGNGIVHMRSSKTPAMPSPEMNVLSPRYKQAGRQAGRQGSEGRVQTKAIQMLQEAKNYAN